MMTQNISCPNCKAIITAVIGEPALLNLPSATIFVIEHPRIECRGCGKNYRPRFNAQLQCTEVDEIPAESKILIPSTLSVFPTGAA